MIYNNNCFICKQSSCRCVVYADNIQIFTTLYSIIYLFFNNWIVHYINIKKVTLMNDKLKIFLITYNRSYYLERTLKQILADSSPIKDFDITILNNASTDETDDIIKKYQKKFPNLKHIKHPINIGGNANIVRAFEYGASSGKEYFWVLCDDDAYEFSNWKEIEKAVNTQKYDLIFTCTRLIREPSDIAQRIHQATFIPGCIYASKTLTSDILQSMHDMIISMFSQTMLSANIISESSEKVYVPNNGDIVVRPDPIDEDDGTLVRGCNLQYLHPDRINVFWHIGFIRAIQIIKDKRKRDYIIQNVRFTDIFESSFYEYMLFIIEYNALYKNNNLKNLSDLFWEINCKQKSIFLCALLMYYSKHLFQQIFSLKNSKDKKHKIVTILGIKFKIKRKKKAKK